MPVTPQKTRRPPVFSRFAIFLLVVLALMITLFAAYQRQFIYYPSTDSPAALERMARTEGFESVANPAGDSIAWMHLPGDGAPPEAVFIVFHGNAGFALHRSYYRDALRELSGDRWACVVLEYPGYGARSGNPTKNTLERAAEEVLEVLLKRYEVPVYLIGESLGSGVATSLAAANPDMIKGLLLVTPFTTLAEVGQRHFPFLPVRLLLRDNFDNTRNLQAYQGPVAFLLAARDRVIPAVLGEKLHDSYHGPRRLWIQREADHNSLDLAPGNDMWKEIGEFLLGASIEKPASGLQCPEELHDIPVEEGRHAEDR